MTGSVAIISEAVHSFLDLLASFMAWAAVRVSDNPADYDHPYGHGRTENLAALFEALLIVAGGVLIVRESVIGLMEGKTLPSLKAGLAVMAVSSVVNLLISQKLFSVGRKLDSPALEADGWHLRTDVYTSAGIFLALALIEIGRLIDSSLNLNFIDSLAAVVVAILIIKTGITLGWEAASTLIDNRLSDRDLLLITEHIGAFYPGILSYRRLKTRRSGPFRFVTVDLVVDGKLTVEEAHRMGFEVVKSIRRHFPGADVTFHLEPKGHGNEAHDIDPDDSWAWDPTGGGKVLVGNFSQTPSQDLGKIIGEAPGKAIGEDSGKVIDQVPGEDIGEAPGKEIVQASDQKPLPEHKPEN
jgi:cation diffusion facilitator family transporter